MTPLEWANEALRRYGLQPTRNDIARIVHEAVAEERGRCFDEAVSRTTGAKAIAKESGEGVMDYLFRVRASLLDGIRGDRC